MVEERKSNNLCLGVNEQELKRADGKSWAQHVDATRSAQPNIQL